MQIKPDWRRILRRAWSAWLIIGAIITAFVMFAIAGGLGITP